MLYTYDALGRLATVDAFGERTTYTYGDQDLPIEVTWPNGVTAESGYDAMGRLVAYRLTDPDGAELERFEHRYDVRGRRVTATTATTGANITAIAATMIVTIAMMKIVMIETTRIAMIETTRIAMIATTMIVTITTTRGAAGSLGAGSGGELNRVGLPSSPFSVS